MPGRGLHSSMKRRFRVYEEAPGFRPGPRWPRTRPRFSLTLRHFSLHQLTHLTKSVQVELRSGRVEAPDARP